MSLGEHEQQIWQQLSGDDPVSGDAEIAMRQDVLRDAERISLADLNDPFGSIIELEFAQGSVGIQLEPWTDEDRPVTDGPILARFDFISTGRLFSNRPTPSIGFYEGEYLLIEGASIEGTNTADDTGVIARNCNLNIRRTKTREVTLFDPFETGVPIEKQEERMHSLLETGWAREVNRKVLEIVPEPEPDFTPPVKQVLETDQKTPVFPENS